MRQEPDVSVPADALSLSELLTRYVSGQVARFEDGAPAPELGSEVSLHDVAGAAQAIDPRLAWDEAVAALTVGGPLPSGSLPAPCSAPDWKTLVASQEPALDLAFCTGNFPQMVRNLGLLLGGIEDRPAETSRSRSFRSDALIEWAEKIAKGTAQAACRRLSEGSSFSVAAKRKKRMRRRPPHSKIQSDIRLRKTVASVAQAPRISARVR